MHPVLLIIPAAALIVGPRLWVETVRRRHDRVELEDSRTGGELARELLERQHLSGVQVEPTDLGDHYDPRRKAVRLTRENFERRSVAALATAAHEVGHALQDASQYPPFLWRADLVRIARGTAEIGGVLLLATPLVALASRHPLPPTIIGGVACAVIGTGVAAQLAALPTEWDASFHRALPLLADGYLAGPQLASARHMLLACSLTYVASSLAAALQLWPWLPRPTMMMVSTPPRSRVENAGATGVAFRTGRDRRRAPAPASRRHRSGVMHDLVRRFGKPLIRSVCRARMAMAGRSVEDGRPLPAARCLAH